MQDPIDGYYRLRPENIENVTDIVDIVGTSAPCKCYGRSEACERETGQCLVLAQLMLSFFQLFSKSYYFDFV